MALHKKAILGEIHKVHNWEYPNATLRLAATGFVVEDIGKVAWQKDNDSFWFLKSNSPVVWQSFANDPSIITEQDLVENIRTAGVVELPTFVYNNDGTCTVGAGQFSLYDNPNYQGVPRTFIISSATLNLTDNSANYIQASYNNGTPIYEVITSVPPTNTTDSDRIPVYSIYRSGNDVHYFDWDHLALGLAEKLNQRIRRTDRFRIDNGLGLSEVPTRTISVASGQVWAGANIISLDSITSSSPETHFYYHTAGNWTRGNLSQYNNLQYDNGTNLVTLTNNKYAVNWVYRSVQQSGAIYVLLGNGDYSLIEAQSSKEPAKPTEISTQAILVGRIIALKGAGTATQIDRVIDVTFGANSVANHNDLSGIQGGISNEHYHLTQAQNTFVDNLDNILTTDGTKLQVNGSSTMKGLALSTRTVAASTTATVDDYTIRCNAADITVTLPAASTVTGSVFIIKKVDSSISVVTLVPNASEVIDGQNTISIYSQYDAVTIQSNGNSWDVI